MKTHTGEASSSSSSFSSAGTGPSERRGLSFIVDRVEYAVKEHQHKEQTALWAEARKGIRGLALGGPKEAGRVDVAELMIFSPPPSASDLDQVRKRLRAKYGVGSF